MFAPLSWTALVNLVQMLAETVFFYHPAVWWLSRRIRAERENCCDDLAVAAVGNRVQYGRALLAIAELRGSSPALAVGVRGGSLLARIQRLARVCPGGATSSPWLAFALLACCLATIGELASGCGLDKVTRSGSSSAVVKKPALEFRVVAGPADKNKNGVAWFPIAKPRMPQPAGKSGMDLPVEEQVDGAWRGLLWDVPEHTMLADGSWRVLKWEVVPETTNFAGTTYSIGLTLDEGGGAKLQRLTKTHFHQKMAIVIDGTIIAAPKIMSEIGARIRITGNFSREEATRLAQAIRGQTPEPSGARTPCGQDAHGLGPRGNPGTATMRKQAVEPAVEAMLMRIQRARRFKAPPATAIKRVLRNDLGEITGLNLKGAQLQEADFRVIGKLVHLVTLDLSGTSTTDENLSHTNVGNDELKELSRLSRLSELNLDHTYVTDKMVPTWSLCVRSGDSLWTVRNSRNARCRNCNLPIHASRSRPPRRCRCKADSPHYSRNPKLETRNKFKTGNSNDQNFRSTARHGARVSPV